MPAEKSVLFTVSLLSEIIDLLGCWNLHYYDQSIQEEYDRILSVLSAKRDRLSLRQAYSRIVYAKTEDERHDARIKYLYLKQLYEQPF